MIWRVALLAVTVTALALAGGALYLHQVDRYPLQSVPTAHPRANAARYCTERVGLSSPSSSWQAPDSEFFPTKGLCVTYVIAHNEAAPDPERSIVLNSNTRNRRRREEEWLVFAAVALIALFAASALVFSRRSPSAVW